MMTADMPVFTDTPTPLGEELIKALNSGYGSITSGTWPYKILSNPTLASMKISDDFNNLTATIEINAQHQSPHGDNWDSCSQFTVPLSDMKAVREKTPMEFRSVIDALTYKMTDALKEALTVEKPKRLAAFKKAVAEMLSSGTGETLSTPPRAAFPNKKRRAVL